MNRVLFFLSFYLLSGVALLYAAGPRPEFSDYPVKSIYKGPHAKPKMDVGQRRFRTRIKEDSRPPVEFAGHYTMPRFGCGALCTMFFIVDAVSGKVYDGFTIQELPQTYLEQYFPDYSKNPLRFELHPDSRLFKINGCIGEHDCGFYDFEMVKGKGLKLIRKELLPKEFQPES